MALVFALSLAASAPTVGDFGLTWDEPAYRFSELRSAQWWERLSRVRNPAHLKPLLDPDALLFYWPYGRHGINFHPPLGGQLNLLGYAGLGRWLADTPARRMASVVEFSLAVALGFGFLSRRYGGWVGGVMAGSLLCMPRVYGQAHLAETDTPGLLLWPAVAMAFWKGLHEPGARRWRVMVGLLLGLAFVQKMGVVAVLGPLLVWLVVVRLPATFTRPGGRASWVDGLVTSAAMLAPLALALAEVLRLARLLPPPGMTDLFVNRPPSRLAGAVLAVPVGVWFVRRFFGRVFRNSRVWGVERPALETWTAVLAFGPVVGWLGNPAWWRETFTRLAHYYLLNTDRRGALPDIRIMYLGQTYLFSLPWHNAWVLIAVTVPAAVLVAAAVGLIDALWVVRRDRLPLFFALNFATLPVLRMFPAPAHDGVRLILPAFFFLAALAGWGAVWLADGLARLARSPSPRLARGFVAALVLAPTAWQLVKVHPYELSYYNEFVGGPRGAWRSGFELSYWYDAFNPRTLAELDRRFPPNAEVEFFVEPGKQTPTFYELQTLGELRPDLGLGWTHTARFPYAWLLTHDSKASAFHRLLFAMTPWYASRPGQLDGLRVATVADPVAVSRAWALWLLADGPGRRVRPRAKAPDWARAVSPRLARFWGEGLTQPRPPDVNEPVFDWARDDPDSLLWAARRLASGRGPGDDPDARRLLAVLDRYGDGRFSRTLLSARPEALVEAVRVLTARPDAVRAVLLREPYTDPDTIGGPLDAGLPPGP